MHIAILHSMTGIGGGERWCVSFLEGMAHRGHRVDLVVRRGTAILDLAKEHGIPVHPCRMAGDLDPTAVLPVASLLRRLRPDVLVANNDKDVRLACIAGRLLARIPVVARSGVEQRLKDKWYYRLFYRDLIRGILANSESNRRVLVDSVPWLDTGRVHVAHNGVDVARFAGARCGVLRRQLGLPPGALLVGYLGRVAGGKGIDVLLRAWSLLPATSRGTSFTRPAHLVLVGEGPERSNLQRLHASPKDGFPVHWLPFQRKVEELYPDLDLFVLPSSSEGFSNALLEAMAAGRCVVASNTSSMPEAIQHGETGWLLPYGDVTAWRDGLAGLLADAALRKRLGEAAQRHVARSFARDSMLQQAEELLTQLARAV